MRINFFKNGGLDLVLLAVLGMVGCVPHYTESRDLVLKSPSGYELAESYDSLKSDVAESVKNIYPDAKDFEVTKIDYNDVGDKYFAVIHFKTSDGRTNKTIRTNMQSRVVDSNKVIFIDSSKIVKPTIGG